MNIKLVRGVVVVLAGIVLLVGYLNAPEGGQELPATGPGSVAAEAASKPESPAASTSPGISRRAENVAVKSYGKVVFRGTVELSATIDRIQAGEKHPHRNDGSVFGNRERLLPRKERGYYREYVHPTKGISGPGPQRIVVGKGGDWWYTPDHYASFVSLGTETR